MNYDGYSLSDIATATGNNGRNNGDGMFGDNWAWIIVLFLIFGWGGNRGFGGFGNGGSEMSGILTRGDLCQDMNFNDLQNAVRSGVAENNSNFRTIDNAICTLGYDNLVQANNTNMAIANGFSRLDTSLCQSFNNVANQVNGLSTQLSDCCCNIRESISNNGFNTQRGIDQVNYNMAMNTNQLQNAMCSNTRDIVEAQNCGTRAILDAITANRIEDKNAQIQAQQNEINALRLSASQERQNNYLVNQLKPCPIPAYITCNPYQSYGFYGNNGCGCNNGCGNNF